MYYQKCKNESRSHVVGTGQETNTDIGTDCRAILGKGDTVDVSWIKREAMGLYIDGLDLPPDRKEVHEPTSKKL